MKVRVIYDFSGATSDELNVVCGDELTVLDQDIGDGWWSAVDSTGHCGLIPSAYVEPFDFPEPDIPPPAPPATYATHQYKDEWDSDEDIPSVAAVQSIQIAEPVKFPPSSSGTAISDSAGPNAVRKGFGKYGSKSGADEYLLKLTLPDNLLPIIHIDYVNGLFHWRPVEETVTCSVGQFAKSSKLHGMKSFVQYRINNSLIPSHVDRRYKQFDWLSCRLSAKCPAFCALSLPPKKVGTLSEEELLAIRHPGLQRWLNWCCNHPVVSRLPTFRRFLSSVDEKSWKQYKREAENDQLQSIRFFFTVKSTDGPVPEDAVMDSIDQFDKYASDLVKVIQTFVNTVNDFHETMSANTGKSFFNLSEVFFSMSRTLDTKVHGKSIVENLIPVFSNIGESVKSISLHHSVRSEQTSDLIACLQDYHSLFTNIAPVLTLGRSACATLEEARRLDNEGKLSKGDVNNIHNGCRVITRSVQAECNFLLFQLQQDLSMRVGAYLRNQVEFYRQMANHLESAALLLQS